MITDLKHLGLFQVDVFNTFLSLPHKQISTYLLNSRKDWNQHTTYHDKILNTKVIENLPARNLLFGAIKDCAVRYVNDTNRRRFANDEDIHIWAWANIYGEHDYHGSHIHPKSLIAGTYFPQADSLSAPLCFEAPWINSTMHDSIAPEKTLYEHKPTTGECLMWPAWLNHRVPTQGRTNNKRISISFNIDYSKYQQTG